MQLKSERPKLVVCGTRFGRVYLAACRSARAPFDLVGILARGSKRSHECAAHYTVPLYEDVSSLPDGIDVACVVVGTGVIGGKGGEIAIELMRRGVHVLQEHPLHHDELARCLAEARRNKVVYQLNTLYPHLPHVRGFLDAARRLREVAPPEFVELSCSVQVSYSALDLVGRALGNLRPWGFGTVNQLPEAVSQLSKTTRPFRSLEGVIGGVPMTLQLQNQMDPSDPDSHAHVLHRIVLGFPGGSLVLADTHGPVLWLPRPNMPREAEHTITLDAPRAEHLDYGSSNFVGGREAWSYRRIVGEMWPAGVTAAMLELQRSIDAHEDPLIRGQYYLTVSKLWQEATSRFGYPDILHGPAAVPWPPELATGAVAGPADGAVESVGLA